MNRAQLALLVGLAAAIGCGGVDVQSEGGAGGQGGAPSVFESTVPPFTAGSRLKPRVLDGGDGAQVLFDFFDQELGTSCAFVPAIDGRFRCMPQTSAPCAVTGNVGQCGMPAFATIFEVDACVNLFAASALQAPAGSPGTQLLQDLRSRNCQGPDPSLAWPGATPFSLESFVGATLELVPVEGNLAVERLVADDGTTVTIGFARDGHRCEPAHFGADLRCVDAYLGSTHTWTSAPEVPIYVGTSCSGDRAGFITPACDEPKPGLASTQWRDPPECPSEVQYFELLDPVGDCSAAVGPDCIPMLASEYASQGTFARLGAEVPPSALPALTTMDVAGTGRLRVRSAVGGGAALGSASMRFASNDLTFFDTELDATCTARIVADVEVRCIPGNSDYLFGYQDAQCSIPLMPPDVEKCGVVTDNRFLARTEGRECGGGLQPTEVWERGAPYSGDVYQKNDYTQECTLLTTGGWFQVGASHPLSDFVVVNVTEL